MNKFRKGDLVIVTTGTDKGKTGEIIAIDSNRGKVKVSKINLVSKHLKATKESNARIDKIENFMDPSNIMHFDSNDKSAQKIKFVINKGKKVRVTKKSNFQIDK